ncbi:MAG: ASPIC/UnbV domain-containing protein [Acidobacteria bacterium]|nr:ASPIC/UnbV domain-containing protein [Acidobacteriota bacterium]
MASSAEAETAGNDEYRDKHMSAIFTEGLSFSGFERDYVGLNLGGADAVEGSGGDPVSIRYLAISGISGADSLSDGRGAAFADFDNDGDTDIFLVALQGSAHHLFRNNIGQDAGFLRIELEGTRSGTDAFGAIVRVKTSAGILTKVKSGGSGFLAQHDPRLLFGLGSDTAAEWVEISWPSGATQRLENVPAGSSIRAIEGSVHATTTEMLVDERRFSLVDPLPPEDALFAKLTIDRATPMPDLSLETLEGADGEATSLYEITAPGRRTLLNIWATWCIPCRKEMPELELLAPRLAAAGIDLVGLSIDTEQTRQRVVPFLESLGITYPSYFADLDEVAGLFRGANIFVPMSILLDENGRPARVFSGWSPATEAALEELVGTSRE